MDRSYEFEVIGNEPFDNGIFSHPAEWTFAGVQVAYSSQSEQAVGSSERFGV